MYFEFASAGENSMIVGSWWEARALPLSLPKGEGAAREAGQADLFRPRQTSQENERVEDDFPEGTYRRVLQEMYGLCGCESNNDPLIISRSSQINKVFFKENLLERQIYTVHSGKLIIYEYIGEALNQSVSRMNEMIESYKKREVEQEMQIQEFKEKIAQGSARLSASRAMRSSLEAISSKVLSDLKQNIQEARHLYDDKDRELEELKIRFTRFLQVCVDYLSLSRRFAGLSIPGRNIDFMSCNVFTSTCASWHRVHFIALSIPFHYSIFTSKLNYKFLYTSFLKSI